MSKPAWLQRAESLFWGAWILFFSFFFFVRFTAIVYYANQAQIDRMLGCPAAVKADRHPARPGGKVWNKTDAKRPLG